VLTGRDLDAIGDEALGEAASATTVFARTSPEHKLRLVQALQKRGEVVAMTGDGVNDAPALKRADIGIAMGVKGTEAAKEAAEMVLADDNFASIVHAVHEGRVVYENLKKTILYILPTNGGEGLTVVAAIAMGETLPVTPVQILWINLITAVTLGLALAFEPPSPGVMLRPPRPSGEPILSRYFIWRIVFVSFLMLLATFGLYELEKARGMGLDSARTVAVNTLVACEVAYLFNARFLSESSLSLKGLFGSRAVLISVAIVVVLQALFTYAPFMQALFNTTPLDPEMWGHIAGASVVLFLLVEVEKAIFRSPARAPAPRGVPAAPAAGAAAVVAPGDWVRPVVAGLLGLLIIVVSGAFYLHTRVSLTREAASAGRTVVVSGVIAPVAQTPIDAPAAGVVATLSCDVGAKVEMGETCATLDVRSFDEASARAQSALAAAERQLAQRRSAQARAQANLQRLESRSASRSASRKSLAAARGALARAQAHVDRAEAEVARRREAVTKAEAGRASAEIVAPVAGVIVERTAVVGARVEAGAPLFMIGDAKTVRLRGKAEGEGALTIAPGAEAVVTSESVPGRTFSGKVTEARRTGSGALVDVVVEVDNRELALRPGMEVSARIGIMEGEASSTGL
jgi:RND family efflux transporter MFP subunit